MKPSVATAWPGTPFPRSRQDPPVSPTATNPLVTQGKKYAFRACFIDPFQGEVAARFARNELKAQTAAVIIDQAQDYCVGLANYFEKEFVKLGGKIVSNTYIQTGDQDFSAQLSAVQATKPDIIYAPNYYTEDALMAKQARDLGIKLPILTGDGAQDETPDQSRRQQRWKTCISPAISTSRRPPRNELKNTSSALKRNTRRKPGLLAPRGGCLLPAGGCHQAGGLHRRHQDPRSPGRHQGFPGGFRHHHHG